MNERENEYPSGYTTAGRYEIVRCLSVGGMGSVYEGFDTKVDRKIAIKFLAKEFVDKKDIRRRFELEAKASGRIDHENVCAVTDWGVTDEGVPFLVMELLKGESLADRLKRTGKLPADQAIELMHQVLSALATAHAQGIVHRDLKPDNIFLSRVSNGRERVKLVDFGIAKFIGGTGTETAHGAVLGTLHYMSPEQARGRVAEVDHRTDIWAAGAIFYEMLTGVAPFGRGTTLASLTAIINYSPTPVHHLDPSIPEHVGVVIQQAMSKLIGERLGSAIEFTASLRGEARGPDETNAYYASGSASTSSDSQVSHRIETDPPLLSSSNVTVPATMVTTQKSPSVRQGLAIAAVVGLVTLLGLGIVVGLVSSRGVPGTAVAPPPPSPPLAKKLEPAVEPEEAPSPVTEGQTSALQPVELQLTGLPEGSTVTYNGALVPEGRVTGTEGERGDLVIEAPAHSNLRMPLTLESSGELDLSDRLQRLSDGTPEERSKPAKASRNPAKRSGQRGSTRSNDHRRGGSSASKVNLGYGFRNSRPSGGTSTAATAPESAPSILHHRKFGSSRWTV